jgi:hypothetical protein
MQHAREGTITPEMLRVAERERVAAELVRDEVAAGRLVIPANVGHLAGRLDPMAIGAVASVKINANIGNSAVESDIDAELEKLRRPQRPAAIVRRIRLAARKRRDRPQPAVDHGRQGGASGGGPAPGGVDQPALPQVARRRQHHLRDAGVDVERPHRAVGGDVVHRSGVPPDDRPMLEVGAGLGGDRSRRPARGRHQLETADGPLVEILGASGRQAEVDESPAVGRQVGAAVAPARLVGAEPRHAAPPHPAAPQAPVAGTTGLPDDDAVPGPRQRRGGSGLCGAANGHRSRRGPVAVTRHRVRRGPVAAGERPEAQEEGGERRQAPGEHGPSSPW